MMSLCTNRYIQQSSGVLVVFVASITVSKMANPEIIADIAMGLKGIWVFAEIFLFTLTGTSLSFNSENGPLYGQRGLSSALMSDVVAILFAGTACRLFALGVCMLLLYNYLPPHRQRWQWLVPFWINCYIFQMPKATVQATLGSVAYYQRTIPGPEGLNQGLIIAQSTAFAVLIFAPLGALLTNYVGCPIALYCTRLDKEAGWDEDTHSYIAKKEEIEEGKDGGDESGGADGGVELSHVVHFFRDSDHEEEEETAVGYHGEILHEPETIDKLVRKASRYIKKRSNSMRSRWSETSSVASHHSLRSSNHHHHGPTKADIAEADAIIAARQKEKDEQEQQLLQDGAVVVPADEPADV